MKYFLYQHKRLDTNQIFYIGKGTKKVKGNVYHRAFTKNSRNNYWLNIVNQTSYIVEILEEFDNEQDCLKKETSLIESLGYSWNNTGTLCNMIKNDSEIKYLARIGSSKKNSKQVHQYTLSGEYIQSFISVVSAIKKYPCDIYNAAAGRNKSAGGYQWSFVKLTKLNSYLKENKSKLVYQYDKHGNFIKEWQGTKVPSQELGIHRGAIRNCLSNIAKTAGGYIWKYNN